MRRLARQLLPPSIRHSLRAVMHARAIRAGRFGDDADPLFGRLGEWVEPGTWTIDVGAAVGTYTIRLSELVGVSGRVVAIEPTTGHFAALVSNARHAPHDNITCLQLAASDDTCEVGMDVPHTDGAEDWYLAQISDEGAMRVWCVPIDSLVIPARVSLLKIDAEGHDFAVLRGAERLLLRDHPTVLIEAQGPDVRHWLEARGYTMDPEQRSPNQVFVHGATGSLASITS